MSAKVLNKILTVITAASIALCNLSVTAQESLIDTLLNCKNGVRLAQQLSALTTAEVRTLGISEVDYNLYKRLKYPKYIGLQLIEEGFSNEAELRAKFNRIVNDAVYSRNYSVADFNQVISFRSETGITNKPRGTSVLWGDTGTVWSGKSLTFVPFGIQDSYAILDGTVQTRSNGIAANNNSSVKSFITEPLPMDVYEKWGFDTTNKDFRTTIHRAFQYKLNDDEVPDVSVTDHVYATMGFTEKDVVNCWAEVFNMWNNYKDSMTAIDGNIMNYQAEKENGVQVYISNSVDVGEEIIAALNAKEDTPLVLGLGAENNNAVLLPAKTVLTFTYDKTAEWEHELMTNPKHDEVGAYATEMLADSESGYDFSTVINDNFYVSKNDDASTPVDFSVEVVNQNRIAISFGEELALGTEYIVGMKNLKNAGGGEIHNREVRFTTARIYTGLSMEFENVLSLGIDMPIRMAAYYDNQKSEEISLDKVEIANSNFVFENGRFRADSYGKDIITAQYTSRVDGTVLQTGVVAVAPAKSDVYKHNSTVSGNRTMMTTSAAEFVAEGWFDDALASGENAVTITLDRERKIGINTDVSRDYYVYDGKATEVKRGRGTHQVAVDVEAEQASVYIDGTLIDSFAHSGTGKSILGAAGNGSTRFGKFGVYIIKDTAPVIKNLIVKNKNEDNTAYLGESIKAEWEYYDAENDPEEGSVFGWYMASEEDGEYELISNDAEIALDNAHFDKWLKFEIVPANKYATGEKFETEPLRVILGNEAKKAVELISKADVFEMDSVLTLYADVLGIEDDLTRAKESVSDMNFIYAQLQYQNFESLEQLQNALSDAISRYLVQEFVYASGFVINEKTTNEGLVEYEFKDAPGSAWNTTIQNITGNDGYVTFRDIPNGDAISNITFRFTAANLETGYGNIMSQFSGYSVEPIPKDYDFSSWTQYDFEMIPARERQYHYEAAVEYDISDYVADALKNSSSLTLKLVGAGVGTTNVYLPSAPNDYQKPQLVITNDLTKIQNQECKATPGNFETGVDQALTTYAFDWVQNVDMLTWNAGNVSLINCRTGEPVNVHVAESATNIEILEELQPLTMYRADIKGLKNLDGKEMREYNFYFMTGGEYETIQAYANTALKADESAAIVTKGICGDSEYVILPEELTYTSSNTDVVRVSEVGEMTAVNRGTAVITVSYQNLLTSKFIVTSYHTADKYTFETDSDRTDEIKYSGKYSLKVENEYAITSKIKNGIIQCWFYDDMMEDVDCGFHIGSSKFEMSGASYSLSGASEPIARCGGWHQVVIENTASGADVYMDSVKIGSVTENISEIKAYAARGNMYIDNCSVSDIKGNVCTAENVTMRGSGYAEQALTGSYIYRDIDNDEESGSEYAWYVANSEGGTYLMIHGETDITFTPSSSYIGKYIKFAVTPKNISDIGDTYYSSAKLITKYVAPSGSGGSGGGGNGGGGSSGGGSSGGVTVPGLGTDPQLKQEIEKEIFRDVPKAHWAYANITALYHEGLINGRTETTFEPDENITRAEFVKLIVEVMELQAMTTNSVFEDVPENIWSYKYIMTAYENGVASGYGSEFRPDENITRQEMAVMIMNALEKKVSDVAETEAVSMIADEDEISDWAKDAVHKAYNAGILSGMEGNIFAPQQNLTRAESATVIKRFYDTVRK